MQSRIEVWEIFIKLYMDFMFQLYERWQCEKNHEDINDYKEAIRKNVSAINAEITDMTKRPFGVKFRCSDGDLHIFVRRDGNYAKIFGREM